MSYATSPLNKTSVVVRNQGLKNMPPGSSALAAKDRNRVAVINERLIRECIYIAPQSGADDDRNKARTLLLDRAEKADRNRALSQQMDLYAVQCLMFSYRGLAKIDNLVGVDNIVKLHLDNNNITKIENLSHLKKLQWLDLSFNNITEIEGLEELTQLQDLSLYSNQITVLKGLDTLLNLSCLSVGKNEIDGLEDTAKYLHKLHKSLRMLTLQGNKVDQQAHYRTRILAYLPNIKFLDNRLIVAEDISKAREEQRENLVPIDEEDAQHEAELKRDAEEKQAATDYKRFNCPNENKFFDEIYHLQPEGKNIVGLLEVEDVAERAKDVFERYREDFNAKAKEFADTMKALRAKRDADDKAFRDTLFDYKSRSNEHCKAIIKAFERQLKSTIPFGLKAKPDPDVFDDEAAKNLRAAIQKLKSDLLEEEADQYDALSSAIAVAIGQYKNDGVDQIVTTSFEVFQKVELDWQTAIRQKLDSFFEERQKEGADSTYHSSNQTEQVKQALSLLENKEEYQKALAEWQELHRKKLEELEQMFLKAEDALTKERSERILREEHQRNRNRIGEIHAYIQRNLDTVTQWEQVFDQ